MHLSIIDVIHTVISPSTVVPFLANRFLFSCILQVELPSECINKEVLKRSNEALRKLNSANKKANYR